MNNSEKKERDKKSSRKDSYIVVGIFSYVCSLILRIPLIYMIGEKGIAYFSLANEIYIAVGCLFTYGLSSAVSMLVRYRVRREQYKNAGKVLRGALTLAVVLGAVLSILFTFWGTFLARAVIKLPLAGLTICMMAPAVIFQILTGVFRGYFEGNGSRVPTMHSVLLETVVMITGGLIGAALLHKYGIKVSALLLNEDYAAAYGAMGASIGILAASIMGFLHMLLLFFLYRGNARKQAFRDSQRSQDKSFHLIHMLIGTAIPFAGYAVLYRIVPLLDGIFFVRTAGEGIDAVLLWGNYYGKYLVVTGVISLLAALPGTLQIKKVIYYVDREEFRMAREKTGQLVHQAALICIPAAVFTAVLSENLLNLLFKGNNEATATYVAFGSILIVLFGFADLFAGILLRMKRMRYVIGCEAISFAVHLVVLLILLENTGLSVMAVVISNIVSFAVLMILGFVLVVRGLQYKQEWLKTIAFTIIAAAVSGLLIMLLNRVLSPFAGTTIALVVCIPVAIIIYMLLLIVTKAVAEEELESMPLGGILLWFGRLIKFM